MFDKKYMRGDPDLPFNNDPAEAERLMREFISPTHEPLWFLRNRGTACPEDVAQWNAFQEPANIDVMAALGMHMPKRMFFFKGIGLERERSTIEKTIAYARELHKRNMLVSVYVGGTIFTDYFFKEVPEARDWCRRDMNDQPVTYGGGQLERWFPCLNNPGYRAYTKRVLDVAVEEVEADEIFFDNQILRYEPRSCRCDYCVQHMRDLVRKKYTLEECLERYGVAEYPDVVPPVFSQAYKPWRIDAIKIPQLHDWIDHRVYSVIDFYREMADHVRAQRPSCVVGMNIKGIHGHNRAFDHGVSHGDFAGILDFSCIDGYRPGRKPGSEAFWSEVRFFKQSHSTGVSVVDGGMGDLPNVENTVLNNRVFSAEKGYIGVDPWGGTPVGRFLCANKRMFYGRERCHDIAVFRYEPATNYNCATVHEQLMPFEQTLIAEGLPWGIIFDRNIGDLDKYRIIALPEIQPISDEWLDALDGFMRRGGGVIATGGACGYNKWYRPRNPQHALERWLGHRPRKEYEAVDVGKGRFVYVPMWDVHQKWDYEDWFAIADAGLRPVKDRDLFHRAVQDATCGGSLTHYLEGSDFIIIEGIAAAEGRDAGVDLHVINHDPAAAGSTLTIRAGLPAGKKKAAVILIDPENEPGGFPQQPVSASVKKGCAVFTIKQPKVYAIVQVRFS